MRCKANKNQYTIGDYSIWSLALKALYYVIRCSNQSGHCSIIDLHVWWKFAYIFRVCIDLSLHYIQGKLNDLNLELDFAT